MKNIFLSSLKESFYLIWKNRFWFFVMFALEIIFFSVFGYANISYGAKVVESSKAIDEYLSKQNLDEVSVTKNILQQKSILGDDPLAISRNFNEMVKNLRMLLVYSFAVLVIFSSILWAFTYKIIHKVNFKKSMKIFFNVFIASLFCYGLIFAFFYSLSNISLMEAAEQVSNLFTKYVPFFIFSIILAYFMFILFSLCNETNLLNIVQKTLSIGIKKIHYIIGAYSIDILFFVLSIILFSYFLDRNLFLLLASIMLMIFSFVFGRIFLINVVEKVEKL